MKMHALNHRTHTVLVIVAFCIAAALPALSASKSQPQGSQADKQDHAKSVADSAPANDGEQKFKQNCSRCHEAPQAISPHISGTILRHMRVRASLSQKDEQAIL